MLALARFGVPALFVFLWSTGWIAARAAAPVADPLTFLAIRFGLAGLVIAAGALLLGARWPQRPVAWLHGMTSGVLLHASYLGGVWWAVKHGLPAGISGLIAALQPLFTALIAWPAAGERLSARQIAGVAIGLLGVALVLYPKLAGAGVAEAGGVAFPVAVNVLAMVGVTLGTFYQKRYLREGDLRCVAALQYLGATPVILLAALLLEPMHFALNPQSIATMAWSVLVLSVGAIALMLMMIRRGEVSKVAALIYLVPPTVAVQAFLLFGETLVPVQVAGMVVTALGVYLTTQGG